LNGDAPPIEEPKARTPAKPKYRNLDNPAITWTGRGKKPEWMQTWIASGKDPNDLLIGEMVV
jgi:DNA-binding protein H-NS